MKVKINGKIIPNYPMRLPSYGEIAAYSASQPPRFGANPSKGSSYFWVELVYPIQRRVQSYR
jgi:hypothetical protein